MAITNSALAAKVNDLVDAWQDFIEEHSTWLNGTVGGGPNLDGEYPLTDYLGTIRLTKSPAQLEDDVSNLVTGAQGYADAADTSATAAAASAATATTQAAAALVSEGLAEDYKDAALAAQTAAESARTVAIAQAAAALSSATDAETAQTAAEAAQAAAEAAAGMLLPATAGDLIFYDGADYVATADITGNYTITGTLYVEGVVRSTLGSDYLQMLHDGNHAYLTSEHNGTGNLYFLGNEYVVVDGGSYLMVRDAGQTDHVVWQHDGTDLIQTFANTDNWTLNTFQGARIYWPGDGNRLQLGSDAGGRGAILGSAQNTDAAALNYRAYLAYDAYWDESNDEWVAARDTLGRKFMMDMGYHNHAMRFRYFNGTVSSPWADSDWTDMLTLDAANTRLRVAPQWALRLYDVSDTNYLQFSHSGSNTSFIMTGGGDFQFSGGYIDITSGDGLRVRDSGNTDYITFTHDGVSARMTATNTDHVRWLNAGLEIENYPLTIHGGSRDGDQAMTMFRPQGAHMGIDSSSQTGAIVIWLPVAQYTQNSMVHMTVKIYEYLDGRTSTWTIGGYPYTSGQWHNTSVSVQGGSNLTPIVRFVYDASESRQGIIIGETSDTIQYPQVWVESFTATYTDQEILVWDDDWDITQETDISAWTTYDTVYPLLVEHNGGNGTSRLYINGPDAYANGKTLTGFIEGVDGNYGSIQVDGIAGASGTWRGYSIGGRHVFMDNGSTTCGIYNDTNNEWMLIGNDNSHVDVCGNGYSTLRVQEGYIQIARSTGSPYIGFYDDGHTPRIGYFQYSDGSVNIRLRGEVHGGDFVVDQEDTGGTVRNLIYGDPDGATSLYYAGTAKIATDSVGLSLPSASTAGSSGALAGYVRVVINGTTRMIPYYANV